jgi:hypothetical protein
MPNEAVAIMPIMENSGSPTKLTNTNKEKPFRKIETAFFLKIKMSIKN